MVKNRKFNQFEILARFEEFVQNTLILLFSIV